MPPNPAAELGLSAVLAAKRALLHSQACPGAAQQRQQGGGAAAPPPAPGRAGEVLPLLELLVGSCPAATQAGTLHCLAGPHLRAAQQRWEAVQGGGMQLWLPLAGGSGGGAGTPASLRLSLLEDPPDASCPFCPDQAASLAGFQQGWPPESTAELLAALGDGGLRQLQSLDVSGSACCADTADVIAASCRQGARAATHVLGNKRSAQLDGQGCTLVGPGSGPLAGTSLQCATLPEALSCCLSGCSPRPTTPASPPHLAARCSGCGWRGAAPWWMTLWSG